MLLHSICERMSGQHSILGVPVLYFDIVSQGKVQQEKVTKFMHGIALRALTGSLEGLVVQHN
jgi:hypothetical protein